MKAKTNIHCNGCQYLDISKRQIKLSKNNYRNTWVLFCNKLDMHIDTIEIKNADLNNTGLPYIESPFVCHKRLELRKQGIESKFETSIN